MKIAITADLHLTDRHQHPERFKVLEDILCQCGDLDVHLLIIAGDLFDQSRQNFADFEEAYRNSRPDSLKTLIIPGNHDPELSGGTLALEDVQVVDEAALLYQNELGGLLAVPYLPESTMGEAIAAFKEELAAGRWILVGHGDWVESLRNPDPYETGVYMPLTRSDLQTYQPMIAFLGHIHLPFDGEHIHYPGSPCPLNINETGLRRFLVFDTENQTLSPQQVDTPRVYFNETIVMLPAEDEAAYLRAELTKRLESWNLPEGWADRTQVRLRINGYCADRSAVESVAHELLAPFTLYDGSIDLSDLNHTNDPDRIHIARQARAWVEELEWPQSTAEPTKDEIMLEALRTIYGVR